MRWFNKRTKTEVEAPKPKDRWITEHTHSISYSHRVWSHPHETGRRIHGHDAEVRVSIRDTENADFGLATDPDEIDWFCDLLKNHIDHRFIIHLEDPWLLNIINAKPIYRTVGSISPRADGSEQTQPAGSLDSIQTHMPLNTFDGSTIPARPVYAAGCDHLIGHRLNTYELSGPEREFFDSFFLVTFVPTTDNLAKWFYEMIAATGVDVAEVVVDIWPKNAVRYSAG